MSSHAKYAQSDPSQREGWIEVEKGVVDMAMLSCRYNHADMDSAFID